MSEMPPDDVNTTKKSKFAEATHHRITDASKLRWWNFDTEGTAHGDAYFMLVGTTTDFTDPDAQTGNVLFHDKTSTATISVNVDKEWANIWPALPSTIFEPDPEDKGTSVWGSLFVKPDFLKRHHIPQSYTYDVKWPPNLGSPGLLRRLIAADRAFAQLLLWHWSTVFTADERLVLRNELRQLLPHLPPVP